MSRPRQRVHRLPLLSCLLFLQVLVPVSCKKAHALPNLHCVTYANTLDPRLSLPLASAERQGFFVAVVGYGLESAWATGLSAMANLVRDYIFNRTEVNDVVLFVDAFDIIFQGGVENILEVFLNVEKQDNKSLLYSTDPYSSSPRENEYPPASTPWKFLNCGVYIGRSWALRRLYKDPLPPRILDKNGKPDRLQNWHTNYFLEHQDEVALDTNCELAQVVFSVEHLHKQKSVPEPQSVAGTVAFDTKSNKIVNVLTKTVPPILHFPGQGHWPDPHHAERMGTCTQYEVLRAVGHPDLARLLESRVTGKYFGLQPWKQMCTKYSTVFDQAAMGVSRFGDNTLWVYYRGWGWQMGLSGLGLAVVCYVHLRRKWHQRSERGP